MVLASGEYLGRSESEWYQLLNAMRRGTALKGFGAEDVRYFLIRAIINNPKGFALDMDRFVVNWMAEKTADIIFSRLVRTEANLIRALTTARSPLLNLYGLPSTWVGRLTGAGIDLPSEVIAPFDSETWEDVQALFNQISRSSHAIRTLPPRLPGTPSPI